MLEINQAAAIDHLRAIGYSDGDVVFLRAIPGKGFNGPTRKGQGIFPNLPWDTLNQFQNEGKGIYFVVNGGGDTDEAVTSCECLFFEHDDLDKSLQRELWQSLGLPQPTAQVETRKSIHTYWLTESIDSGKWREIQTQLLDFADADRSLKNPSRVMRLAGSWHVKQGEEPIECKLLAVNDGVVPLNSIVELVRPAKAEKPQQEIEYTFSDGIPLENCLTKDDRQLISGGLAEGGRNHAGAKLARNLLATEQYLVLMDHRYQGNARSLFDEYCSRCSPPLDAKEADVIWRSAQKKQHKPSLTAEAIENCIKHWNRKQSQPEPQTTPIDRATDETPLDDWAAFRQSVLKLTEIADPFERNFRLRQTCNSYRMPITMGQEMLEVHHGRIKKFEPIDVIDFMAQKQGDREWLVAAHIPLGAVINLCAMGGAGKTSLAYEWAKSIALGLPWNGYPAKESNVLLIQSDEPEMDAQEKLDIQNFYELPKNRCFIFFNWIASAIEQLEAFIKAKDIKFIVIDSLAAMNLGMDRDRSEFADNLRILRDIANENKCTFLVLDHTNKSGGNLGTIAVHNAVSEMMYLKFPTEDERRLYLSESNARDYRILTWEKSRSGLKGTQFVLRQRPANYTNEHLGELERLSGGPQDKTLEFLKWFQTRQEPISAAEFGRLFEMDYDDASAKLESMRRTGMIGGTWIVPEKGSHAGKRWRVYHSIHKVELPPDEPEEEVIEYTYTITDDSDF